MLFLLLNADLGIFMTALPPSALLELPPDVVVLIDVLSRPPVSTERIIKSFGAVLAAANPTFSLDTSSVESTFKKSEACEAIVSNPVLMLDKVFWFFLSDSEIIVGLVLAITLVTFTTSFKIWQSENDG